MSIVLGLLDLDPQVRSRKIEELADKEFDIPFSQKTRISRATIYRWLSEYQKSARGEALLPKQRSDRGEFRKLSLIQKNALLRWRYDNPYRPVEELRMDLLSHAVTNTDPVPSENTIARFLRASGLDRKTLIRERATRESARRLKKITRLAFEAEYPQRIWQADTKGPKIMVQDPEKPDQLVAAKLIVFMDDYSRYITGARYVIEENEEHVMAIFRSAIATYGVPDILYVDLGSPYSGHALLRAATLVGCRVLHTPQGDAASKGKIERKMSPFKDNLESELALLPSPLTLDMVNECLAAVISQHYHVRVHSTTGERPIDRYASFPMDYRRFVSEKTLALIFLPCTTSRVTKTCIIRLHNLRYLVPDPRLVGQMVEVRYNPLDLSKVFVFFDDEFRGEAYVHNDTADFAQRQAELAKMASYLQAAKASDIPPVEAVPYYSFLERKLAAYRLEKESFLEFNAELREVRTKREMVKATLLPKPGPENAGTDVVTTSFGPQEFTHLLEVLLKRKLTPSERLKISTFWGAYGPLDESLVRTTVGRLLGEGTPTSEISAYLDAIKIATSIG